MKCYDSNVHQRSLNVIAQGALTNSKRPESFVLGEYPTHLVRGEGAFVYDTKLNKYLDYICGLGVNLIGYGNAKIAEAIKKAYSEGASLSLSSTLEIEYGERIKALFPIERLRIYKTGSEACSAAVRIARAYNNKTLVLSEGYHGWHEEFISLTPPAKGCVNYFQIERFTKFEQLEIPNISAVIIEPIITVLNDERVEWLHKLREECTKKNIVLIFDETITGCRFPKLSVSKFLGIEPDLIILGKAIGGGLPLSIVGGKKEIMEGKEYFCSSTFSGDRVAMIASMTFLDILQREGMNKLWESGNAFIEDFNALDLSIKIEGYPTRGVFVGHEIIKAMFFQEAINCNILFGASWFFSYALREHSFTTINTCKDIFNRIKTGQVTLRGKVPTSPFSLKARNYE